MDINTLIGTLKCPNCHEPLTEEQILEKSTVSWPFQDWILFLCPFCHKTSHVEVKTDSIRTGLLDGFPGPTFYPYTEMNVPDFNVYTTKKFIECTYNGIKYTYKSALLDK